jgi:hypothetical protein
MADTATTRNRGRKPESGQYNNAWAAQVNEDLISDRMDEALDGRVTFTLSGSKTLTSTNYETDEARMRFIDITSGTGGTVTIPAVEKWYIVRNATSGDVVFSAGGATTATVKSGNVGIIVTDGSSVYLLQTLDFGSGQLKSTATASAASHLVNKSTMDAAILAATMTAGGISITSDMLAFLADPTSAKLRTAMSDETGTGANVFADSPTFTSKINLTPGSAPGTPGNGDVWVTASGIYVRAGGVTVGPLIDASSAPNPSWTQIGSTQSPSAVASSSITGIAQTYQDLYVEFLGLSHSGAGTPSLQIQLSGDNGSTWTAAAGVTASTFAGTATIYGSTQIPAYRKDAGSWVGRIESLTADHTTGAASTGNAAWRIAGGIDAIRLLWSGGENFDAGSWKLWGK